MRASGVHATRDPPMTPPTAMIPVAVAVTVTTRMMMTTTTTHLMIPTLKLTSYPSPPARPLSAMSIHLPPLIVCSALKASTPTTTPRPYLRRSSPQSQSAREMTPRPTSPHQPKVSESRSARESHSATQLFLPCRPSSAHVLSRRTSSRIRSSRL